MKVFLLFLSDDWIFFGSIFKNKCTKILSQDMKNPPASSARGFFSIIYQNTTQILQDAAAGLYNLLHSISLSNRYQLNRP